MLPGSSRATARKALMNNILIPFCKDLVVQAASRRRSGRAPSRGTFAVPGRHFRERERRMGVVGVDAAMALLGACMLVLQASYPDGLRRPELDWCAGALLVSALIAVGLLLPYL